jgi:hypothetical protein
MIMAPKASVHMTRVTVTLPVDLVAEIDRWEKNRSRFIAEGVRREVLRRRREALRRSLRAPHHESSKLAEEGVADWFHGLPAADASLLDPSGGRPIAWEPGRGWVETDE